MPIHKPHLSVGVAGGPDGLLPEYLRWTLTGRASSEEGRDALCSLLAIAFTKAIDTCTAPDVGTDNISTPIWKEPKPGQVADASNPEAYRFITVGSILYKIFELVLLARLSHWAIKANIIGSENEQVGFMPDLSAELHVFTLIESVKYEWRHNRSVYALFIDLKKAFDTVNHEALSAVLAHMGIPPKLVALLSNAASRRVTRIAVNGKLSDPIHMSSGVGQGSVLSPLLFILFIESLNRTFRADERLIGVTIGRPLDKRPRGVEAILPLNLRSLFYADDIAILANNPRELEIALDITAKWCEAWQMEIGVGRGKTEAVALLAPPPKIRRTTSTVPPPPHITRSIARSRSLPVKTPTVTPLATTPPPLLPPLVSGTITVKWSLSYRYLGFDVTPSLSTSEHERRCSEGLRLAYHRFVAGVESVRNGPSLMTGQIYKTYSLAAITYLAGIIDTSQAFLKTIDSFSLKAARLMLPGAGKKTLQSTLWAFSGLIPAHAIILSHRARLHLFLTAPSLKGTIAGRLYELLKVESATSSWATTTKNLFIKHNGTPINVHPVPRNVSARHYAHTVAAKVWSEEGSELAATHITPLDLSLPVASPAAAVLKSLTDAFANPRIANPRTAGKPGPYGELAPGSGGLLGTCTDPLLPRDYRSVLLMLTEGRRIFFSDFGPDSLQRSLPSSTPTTPTHPLPRLCSNCRLRGHTRGKCTLPTTNVKCKRCRLRGHLEQDCTNDIAPLNAKEVHNKAWARAVNGNSPCPLCDHPEPMGPAHLLIRCKHPRIVAYRSDIIRDIPFFLGNLVTRLDQARNWQPFQEHLIPANQQSWKASAWTIFQAAQDMLSWNEGHGAWVLFRSLMALPWTSFSINETPPPDNLGLATQLAYEFDTTHLTGHRTRHVTNWWLRWAGKRSLGFCQLWKDEVDSADRKDRLRRALISSPSLEFVPSGTRINVFWKNSRDLSFTADGEDFREIKHSRRYLKQ